MKQPAMSLASAVALAATAILVACSGGVPNQNAVIPAAGGANIPSTESGLLVRPPGPYAGPVVPVKSGETFSYDYSDTGANVTWSGPTASPVSSPVSDSGSISSVWAVDPKNKIYNATTTSTSKAGTVNVLSESIGFVKNGKNLNEVEYAYNIGNYDPATTVEYSEIDTLPQTMQLLVLPLTTGAKWKSSPADIWSLYETTTSSSYKYAQSQNTAANGSYTEQDEFTVAAGAASDDNYAETQVFGFTNPAVYTYSRPAEPSNQLTQTFGFPAGGKIKVRSSGVAPLPAPTGTVRVPDWYPGKGAVPKPAITDKFKVVGPVAMPTACGSQKGKTATEVDEDYDELDPVSGYYLAENVQNYYGKTFLVCLTYTSNYTTYANGLFYNGTFGKPISQHTETYAEWQTGVKGASRVSRALAAVPAFATNVAPFHEARARAIALHLASIMKHH